MANGRGRTTYRDLCRGLTPLYGEREARAVADLLLEDGFSLTKADVMCGAVERLSPADSARLSAMYDRLLRAEPVQYVTGRAMFLGRMFSVGPGVLIPRPETEELCAAVISRASCLERPRILDIGTGSGCIAVSLALGISGSRVTAWDVSPAAAKAAEDNARSLGASVSVVRQDALSAKPQPGRWDIIVSNPPYICYRERQEMARNVLDYEPGEALFVPDSDPLLFYRAIGGYARASLRRGGSLWFEVNSAHADDTAGMLRSIGFTRVEVREDMFGRKRMVMAEG